jgi:hypothetical protein
MDGEIDELKWAIKEIDRRIDAAWFRYTSPTISAADREISRRAHEALVARKRAKEAELREVEQRRIPSRPRLQARWAMGDAPDSDVDRLKLAIDEIDRKIDQAWARYTSPTISAAERETSRRAHEGWIAQKSLKEAELREAEQRRAVSRSAAAAPQEARPPFPPLSENVPSPFLPDATIVPRPRLQARRTADNAPPPQLPPQEAHPPLSEHVPSPFVSDPTVVPRERLQVRRAADAALPPPPEVRPSSFPPPPPLSGNVPSPFVPDTTIVPRERLQVRRAGDRERDRADPPRQDRATTEGERPSVDRFLCGDGVLFEVYAGRAGRDAVLWRLVSLVRQLSALADVTDAVYEAAVGQVLSAEGGAVETLYVCRPTALDTPARAFRRDVAQLVTRGRPTPSTTAELRELLGMTLRHHGRRWACYREVLPGAPYPEPTTTSAAFHVVLRGPSPPDNALLSAVHQLALRLSPSVPHLFSNLALLLKLLNRPEYSLRPEVVAIRTFHPSGEETRGFDFATPVTAEEIIRFRHTYAQAYVVRK